MWIKVLFHALIITLSFHYTLFANDGDLETITLTEVMNLAINSDQDITIEKKEIVIANKNFTKRYGLHAYLSETYPDKVDSAGMVVINQGLILLECTINETLYFDLLNFKKRLVFTDCDLNGVKIRKSNTNRLRFNKNKVTREIEMKHLAAQRITIAYNRVGKLIEMDSIAIKYGLIVRNNTVRKGEIRFINSRVTVGAVTMGDNDSLSEVFKNCEINLGPGNEFNHYELFRTEPVNLTMTGNTIDGDSTTRVIFNKSSYHNLNIQNNIFKENVYFIENKATERFFLVDNVFEKHVSFDKFLFSEIWNELYWDQLSGYKLKYNEYSAINEEDYAYTRDFNNLIKIYKGLHTIFLSRGDLRSANACYSEMKELQGRMHKYIYHQDPTFGNFLRWQLNVLLKLYTNHGTDPGLAVVMSFYVIVTFSLLYIFFPSEWDKTGGSRLREAMANLGVGKSKVIFSSLWAIIATVSVMIINAVTLSINSFVTLGFGSIPTNGFARYLCIIEGFIGWFLLSIFSVSLINQVLA